MTDRRPGADDDVVGHSTLDARWLVDGHDLITDSFKERLEGWAVSVFRGIARRKVLRISRRYSLKGVDRIRDTPCAPSPALQAQGRPGKPKSRLPLAQEAALSAMISTIPSPELSGG